MNADFDAIAPVNIAFIFGEMTEYARVSRFCRILSSEVQLDKNAISRYTGRPMSQADDE